MINVASRLKGLTSSKNIGQVAVLEMLKERGRPIIDLSLGEFKVPPPKILLDAVANCLTRSNNCYTDTVGIRPLREQLAARITAASGREWKAENIAVTTGAKQALFNAAATVLEPLDEVLIPAPYWTTFSAQVQLVGARPITVDLSPYGFSPYIGAFEASITPDTRAILLNSPNNPTGRVYTRDEWLALFELAKRHQLWVIIDECYKDFCFTNSGYVSPAALWDGDEEKLILIHSFSKSLSVAGWRLGYMAAHAKLIDHIKVLQNHTTSNPSSLIQHAMSLALQHTDFSDFISDRWRDLADNRNAVIEEIEFIQRDPSIVPAGGFFYYVPTALLSDIDENRENANDVCNTILEETGVLVVPGTAFGDKQGFRMSFCGDAKELRKGAQYLQAFFASHGC